MCNVLSKDESWFYQDDPIRIRVRARGLSHDDDLIRITDDPDKDLGLGFK